MLLQHLKEYSDRLDLPPMLYAEGAVRYIIELDEEGKFLGMTDTADLSSRRTTRGQRRLVPRVQRSSSVRPLLLADKADYVLGYEGSDSDPDRVQTCHKAFLDLVDRCATEAEEPAVLGVQSFLRGDPLAKVEPILGDAFDAGATITFRVGDCFPIDLPAVQDFWASWNEPDESTSAMIQCVVCGEEKPALERLQAKIKGVPGGQTSGTSIISANAEAFESYGLRASLVAPTCAECGERFTQAANDLLARDANRIVIGGAAFIFWTRVEVGLDLWSTFNEPRPEEVAALIDSARRGGWAPEGDDVAFYATSLSGNGGRVVVRDWLDSTVGEVKHHLASWFQRQSIVDFSGAVGHPYGLRALAFATVRKPRDLPATTPRALLRAALTRTPVPWDILYQAVRRNPAEQAVTRRRAALIKLVLLSQQLDHKEDEMVQLDPDNPNPAYRCGRLMAVLEEVQRAAIPNVNATVVGRFYGTASTAPVSVFPWLLRGAQPHFAKLQRDNRGAYVAIQRRLEEIMSGLPGDKGFPRILTLEEQGYFALGYYHQRAHDSAQAREAAERRHQVRVAESGDDLQEASKGPAAGPETNKEEE